MSERIGFLDIVKVKMDNGEILYGEVWEVCEDSYVVRFNHHEKFTADRVQKVDRSELRVSDGTESECGDE